MKASFLAIALSIAGKVCIAQLNFYYTSGRLFEDPETLNAINSPFLAFHQDDEQQWIAYDTKVEEGRFVSVSSSYSTAVACGYVKGHMDFLGNQVVTPSDEYTAVAVSVRANQKVEWFYTHNTGIVPSKFHWVQKLKDGMTLLSGHEYDGNQKTAILLRINKSGEVTWSQRLPNALGLEVHTTSRDRIYWMTTNPEADKMTVYEIDQFTGSVKNSIKVEGKTSSQGIRASKSLYLSENDLLLARISENPPLIKIDQFSLDGKPIQSFKLPYLLDYGNLFELQGVTKRPNGNLQLALNLKGSIAFADQDPIHTSNTKEILLVTLDPSGYLEGVEKYGSQKAGVSGIYRIEDKVAITGSHRGTLEIQSQTLEYKSKNGTAQSYLVYLEEYDPMSKVEDLPFDPSKEIASLTIYPNPVTIESSISILHEEVQPDITYEIRVYDNNATLQSHQLGMTRFESSRDEVSVTSLPSGIFHVFVIQNDEVTSRGKFIITR